MNLWVRSQDKENSIPIKNPICVYDNKIIYKESASYVITIGEYKTKERALEVLDEIQRTIAKNQSLISLMHNFTDLKGNEECVAQMFKDMIYQMPEN